MNSLSESISALNSVAMGDIAADLVLKNCSLVNVYTREIIKQSQVSIKKGRIAYVGLDARHTVGKNTVTIDLEGKYLTPGFADPHTHIDQFILPSELAKQSLLCGVTSIFSDPIDIVSTCGYSGFRDFIKLCSNLPLRIFNMVPGGLPVDKKFSHSKTLSLAQEKSALNLSNVLGLGEVFSWTKVTNKDSRTMKSLKAMLESNCIINGHTAGATDKKLNAYVSSGILSCHEPINSNQVLERLRLGMWVMMRDGSIRRDLKDIIPQILENKTYTNRLMFCSDGLDPFDLKKFGHIDHCIRESVKLGVDVIDAITMASKNCFDYYNLGKDLGGIAPGKLADLLVLDDLTSIKPRRVFVGGKLLVSNGTLVGKTLNHSINKNLKNTVKMSFITADDFIISSKKSSVSVNTIKLKNEIITQLGRATLPCINGNIAPCIDQNILKVAAFDRTSRTRKHTVGFLENFGGSIGAFASTWSFHENDLIVIGSNESDMALAANQLVKSQGGMIAVSDGDIIGSMPLQLAGIISTKSFEKVYDDFVSLTSAVIDSGCNFEKPHLVPLFLPFLALPSVRILYKGIVDVKKRSYLSPTIS